MLQDEWVSDQSISSLVPFTKIKDISLTARMCIAQFCIEIRKHECCSKRYALFEYHAWLIINYIYIVFCVVWHSKYISERDNLHVSNITKISDVWYKLKIGISRQETNCLLKKTILRNAYGPNL